ncbi:Endonuclease/exonuclease/phosphatase [Zychaea mexicana]|uniref:Endonuclease/exonuclease/phosphatase n=1 Tax=Zychaea mexicana TaxID=64656 RepID=UPI0022FE4226|nr:Endonuclease/exonuclease/phosphatase [Zychaea mexicana]KAI9485063.1 Endonuclease/exonuclease/phosphatase [Zychaea mexicana]
MGKDQFDIEKLKQEKKAKKLEQKKLSQNQQQTQQQQQPKPFVRSFHVIPNRKQLAKPPLGTFTIMSFNILGQCLVKRKLFPDSGDMLKWKLRRNMVSAELELYKPDVMCLQEVDNYEQYYKPILERLGYNAQYTKHDKKLHGLLIAYNPKVFEMTKYETVDYDDNAKCPKTWITSNIGQVMGLRHVDHPNFGLVVGNTHLYWRPVAIYERVRQATLYIDKIISVKKSLEEAEPDTQWVPMPIGDFNMNPTGASLSAITMVRIPPEKEEQLEDSRKNPGSLMKKSSDGEEEAATEEAPAEQDEPSEAVDHETSSNTMPTSELIAIVHKEAPEAWHSVYSCHGSIDPNTSDPVSGEPKFTNYTAAFKNTLDYMLLRRDEASLAATEILVLPPEESMKPSLPNRNFGSDHMCLLARFEFAV